MNRNLPDRINNITDDYERIKVNFNNIRLFSSKAQEKFLTTQFFVIMIDYDCSLLD